MRLQPRSRSAPLFSRVCKKQIPSHDAAQMLWISQSWSGKFYYFYTKPLMWHLHPAMPRTIHIRVVSGTCPKLHSERTMETDQTFIIFIISKVSSFLPRWYLFFQKKFEDTRLRARNLMFVGNLVLIIESSIFSCDSRIPLSSAVT